MLTAHSRASISVLFEDREGNHGRYQLWAPFAISASDLQAAMSVYLAGLQPMTDAYLPSYTITRKLEDDSPGSAGADSDALRSLALYYSNLGVFDRLWIPSGRLTLLESIGPYAGIRLDALRPDVAAILLAMQDVTAFIVTPEGDSFPGEFVVGGIAL